MTVVYVLLARKTFPNAKVGFSVPGSIQSPLSRAENGAGVDDRVTD
jgi:hypothetical protein